jgi:hypothetical protein
MTPESYIQNEPAERQALMASIHAVVVRNDKTVTPVVEPMMGKTMIIYKSNGLMKYALAGAKNYMTIHVLPIYGSKTLYDKYHQLLPKASFQKGCINFNNEEELPLAIAAQLITIAPPLIFSKSGRPTWNRKKRSEKT